MLRLKELQKDSEYTIEENAKRLNMPKSTYNNYLIGARQPDINTLIKLADYFGVSMDYLLFRSWDNKIGYIPEDKIDTIKKLLSLNERQFDKANSYIEALVDATAEIKKELKGY